MEFHERLAEILESRDITAYRVRKDLKLSNSRIADWLGQISFPDGRSLIKLADYFDVSIDYLVGRTDNPEVNK